MSGVAVITEACIGVKDRACVDVCPVQCIYEFDPANNLLVSEAQAGNGITENSHTPVANAITIFGDSDPGDEAPSPIRSIEPAARCISTSGALASASARSSLNGNLRSTRPSDEE